ncbi:hypothetical protein JCM15765_11930 [Paradesulfitobacterium aromaticivorans]
MNLNEKWCKKCGLCVHFCPQNALGFQTNGFPQMVKPEKCSKCLVCEMYCPDFAIEIVKNGVSYEF